MLELARRRLGPAADLADLCRPLPFGDGVFDDVVAALVLHYLEDWTAPLAELRRVLKPGGRLIVAVDHPFVVNLMHREAGRKPDYFATYNHTAEWTMGGQTARMSFWHRPLHAMTDAFTAAGFRIAVISEPPPAPGARELFPESLAYTSATVIRMRNPARRSQLLRTGSVGLGQLAFEAVSKGTPDGSVEVQHRSAYPVLRVADRDGGSRFAHLHAVALTACVAGHAPVKDHLIAHRSLLISVMSCAESIGDSAHPLIMLSAVAMVTTSFGSLMTRPEPHPSR
jgi:hypothetical protein